MNVQLVNPRKKARRRRRNPPPAASNPRRRRRHNPSAGGNAGFNPGVHTGLRYVAMNPRRRRRRNPYAVGRVTNPRGGGFVRRARSAASGAFGGIVNQFKLALPIVAGIYLSKYLTRLWLKDRDAGAMGYAVNAGVGVGLATAARMAGKRQLASGIAVGAFAGVILRALIDQVPRSVLPAISGVNDYITGGSGLIQGLGVPEIDLDHRGYSGFGDYVGGGVRGLADYIGR